MVDLFEDDLEWFMFLDDGVSITIEKKKQQYSTILKKNEDQKIRDEKLQQIVSKLWYHIKLKVRKWKKRKPFLIEQRKLN